MKRIRLPSVWASLGICILLLFTLGALAAEPKMEWAKTSNLLNSPNSPSVAIDSFGNICFTMVFYTTTWQQKFQKFDTKGNILSEKTFSIISSSGFNSSALAPDQSGNLVDLVGGGGDRAAFYFLNPAETLLSPSTGISQSIGQALTTNGAGLALFAVGCAQFSFSGVSYNKGMVIGGVNSQGQLTFSKQFGSDREFIPRGIRVDANNNLLVCGFISGSSLIGTNIINVPNGASFIGKFTPNGDPVWFRTLNPSSVATSLIISATGDLWITAKNFSNGSTYLEKLSSEGILVQSFYLGFNVGDNNSDPNPFAMAEDSSGNLIIAGIFSGTRPFGLVNLTALGPSDVALVSVDRSGTYQWVKKIVGIGDARPSIVGPGGNLVLGPNQEIYLTFTEGSNLLIDGQPVSSPSQQAVYLVKFSSSLSLPVITAQPQSSASLIGSPLVLSVAATNAVGASYQWYFNDAPIVGGTSATLTIDNYNVQNAGSYYVVITTASGSVRSSPATIITAGEANIRVTTLAGDGTPGYKDGPAGSGTKLNEPDEPSLLPDGNIIFADTGNHRIRIISPEGAVGTFAGTGEPGWADGPATSAKFNRPLATFVDQTGDIFIAGGGDWRVRQISAFGLRTVTTIAGNDTPGFVNEVGSDAEFNFPNDLTVDHGGVIYSCDFLNNAIRKILTAGRVTTFAGTGAAGYSNGAATNSLFDRPSGIFLDASGTFYVSEWGNHTIRKITADGNVSRVAGIPKQAGLVDGPAASAKFNTPGSIKMDNFGNLYVADYLNHAIRRIDPSGMVTTLVGNGQPGFVDGDRTTARLRNPTGLLLHPAGYLLVTEQFNHAIRKIEWLTNTPPSNPVAFINLNPAVTVYGTPGATFRIEAAESLESSNWAAVGYITLRSSVDTWYDPQPASRRKRFYRLVQQ